MTLATPAANSAALLTDCRRIFIHDLSIEASIGFHEFEKQARQRVLISIDVYIPIANSTSGRDDVRDVTDYDQIRSGIIQLATSRHFNLQETLIDAIAEFCLAMTNVRAVRIESQKPDIYPDCKTVGVEVFRWA